MPFNRSTGTRINVPPAPPGFELDTPVNRPPLPPGYRWDDDPNATPTPQLPPGFVWTDQIPPPPKGFVLDTPQRTQDAATPAPSPGLFDESNLKAGAYATQKWTDLGAQVLNSPQRAQVEAYANAKGVSATPEVAGEYLKSTLPPERVQQLDRQNETEGRIVQFIQSRDQLGTAAAQQYAMNHPGASDQDIYRYVHQNLLNAGLDSSKLPAFTIDPQTKEVKTDVGLVHGLIDRAIAGTLAFPQATAEAGARLIQQGVYQASKPFYGDQPNPYATAVQNQNAGLSHFNQALGSNLQGSTFGQQHPLYGFAEEAVAQVPSFIALAGLGTAGKTGKVAEWAQVAGNEFNAGYEKTYGDAVRNGIDPVKASELATATGAVDAAVNTYLMKFGLLGQKGGDGLRGRLTTALTAMPAQGGVAGTQNLVRQLVSYAATGQDADLEQVMHAAIGGAITGAVGGFAMPVHGAAQSAAVERGPVPTPTPEALAAAMTARPGDASATGRNQSMPVLPPLVESAVPKFRIQEGDTSRGIKLDFEHPDDKALYVATEPRQGKRPIAARNYLKGQGYDDAAIDRAGIALRARIETVAGGARGDTLRVPRLDGGEATGAADAPATVKAVSSRGVNNSESYRPANQGDASAFALTRRSAPSDGLGVVQAEPTQSSEVGGAREGKLPDVPAEVRKQSNNAIRKWAGENGYNVSALENKGKYAILQEIGRQQLKGNAASRQPIAEPPALPPGSESWDAGRLRQWAEANGYEIDRGRIVEKSQAGPDVPPREQVRQQILEQGAPQKVDVNNSVDFLPSREEQDRAVQDVGRSIPGFRRQAPANREQVEAQQALRKRGVEIVYFDGQSKGFRAKKYPGMIFVNRKNVGAGLREAVVHEFVHELHDSRPGLFKELMDTLPPEQRGQIEEWYAREFEAMRPGEKPVSLGEEGVTTPFGKMAADDRIWRHIAGENPTLARKLLDILHGLLTSMGMDKYTIGDKAYSRTHEQIRAMVKALQSTAESPVRVGARRSEAESVNFLPKSEDERVADRELIKGAGNALESTLRKQTGVDKLAELKGKFDETAGNQQKKLDNLQFLPGDSREASDEEVENNLKAAGYELRDRPNGQWVLPGGKGVSPTNSRGIVNHYEAAFDSKLSSESHAKSDPVGAVNALLKRGWLRVMGLNHFETWGLPESHTKIIEAKLTNEHKYTPDEPAYIDDVSQGKSFSFPLAEFAENGFDLRKTLKGADVYGYSPAEPSFLPGKAFVDEDLKPLAKETGEAVSKAWDGVKSLVAPFKRSAQGQTAANVFRERGSELAQRFDRLGAAFDESKKFMDKLPKTVTRQIIDDMENGRAQSDPAFQPVADAIRGILDDRLQQVQALGTGKLAQFVQDYFPHLWKDPKKAAGLYAELAAKAPIEGTKKFLKKRTLQFFSDGIAKGLEPVTENPVEAMMLRVREMDKYITAQQAFKEMEGKGLLVKIKARDPLPFGFAKINDNIATIYAKPSRKGAVQVQGYYVAPEPVANVINNYLSPGIRGNKHFGGLFRGYLGVGNLMNAAQLGLSGFHLSFVTMDSAISRLALGIEQAARGEWKKSTVSVAKTATILGPVIDNVRRGNLVMQEWYRPGTTTPEIAAIVHAMKAAGGRVKMDSFYRTEVADRMMEAFRRGNTIGGVIRLPFAAIEATAKPILENLVPRVKLGAFMDLAQHELAKNPGMTHDELRSAMGKVWDSIDNRLGEMVYDNLFWDKTFKDVAMASVRAVGWNLGTFREIGGGLGDFVKAGADVTTGKGFKLTHRMAYTTAMPAMVGVIGGVIHYMLTGKRPDGLKDLFFPKTGQKDNNGHDVRLALPSYMKDVWDYGQDVKEAATEGNPLVALTTLKHKTHPLLNTILEMLSNEDYYGTKIRNEDDPIVKQLLDVVEHGGKALLPFGVRNLERLTEEGQGARAALPFFGITQARKDIVDSDAELLASKLTAERMPRGSRTQAEADKSKLLSDIASRLRRHDDTARTDLRVAMKAGVLNKSDFQGLKVRFQFQGLQRSVRHLDISDAMKVWDVATPEERRKLMPIILPKLRASKSLTRDQRVRYMRQLQDDWKTLRADGVLAGGR